MKFSIIFASLLIIFFVVICSGCVCCGLSNFGSQPVGNNNGQSSAASPTPIPKGFSQNNPAGIGDTIHFTSYRGFTPYEAEITITDVLRGEPAFTFLNANQIITQDVADPNLELLLCKFKFHLIKWGDTGTFDTWDSFQCISNKELIAPFKPDQKPQPQFEGSIYEGATKEGWITLACYKDDPSPLIVYEKDSNPNGGIWFKPY